MARKRRKRRIKVRKTWQINPRTRIKKSKKIYRRPKAKSNLKKVLSASSRDR